MNYTMPLEPQDPAADGGVVFEIQRGKLSERVRVPNDGETEYLCISGMTIIERRLI